MQYYVGLDVSMKTVSVCIINGDGQIFREIDINTDPNSIHSFLVGTGLNIEKIGLESGSLTHWLTKGLRAFGYEVHPMEARKMAAILATIVNKTDKNDARGIAEALRAGHYRKCVHRSDEAMSLRTILHSRDLLVRQRTQIGNSIRGLLKVYGIRLKKGRGSDFQELVKEGIADLSSNVKDSMNALLAILTSLDSEISTLDKLLKEKSKADKSAQLLKTIDGVGDITALAYIAEIDELGRFKNSRDVAAYIGLTPRQYSSGEISRQGKISKQGANHLRFLLVEAATVLLTRCQGWSPLKAWGLKLLTKKGKKKAIVAVARKMAVMMHSMLKSQKPFNRMGRTAKEIEKLRVLEEKAVKEAKELKARKEKAA